MSNLRNRNGMNKITHNQAKKSFKLDLQSLSLKKQLQISISSCFPFLAPDAIPLSLLPASQPLTYRSAIALKLSSSDHDNQSPQAVATTIVAKLLQNQPKEPNLSVDVHIHPQGWLDFLINHGAIALWLQKLPNFIARNNSFVKQLQTNCNIFPLQYTHARCSALLRLGEQEGRLVSKGAISGLRWTHPKEWKLLHQLMITFDRLMTTDNPDVMKLAMALCESFWNFEKDCRIWGDGYRNHLDLARSRLKLVEIIQQVLSWLLLQRWGITPLRDL